MPRSGVYAKKERGMITTCTHCSARYRLDGEKVPHRMIRVRCPGCQEVFTLDGTADRQESLVDDTSSGFITGFEAGGVGPSYPAAAETAARPGSSTVAPCANTSFPPGPI